ncbi:MAG: hypothetical protein K2W82_08100 [Candidatus Obscuribacterales bacterium]|nr:hypothetical protein [Candidatus Obscuribacterales bacterium]
MKIPLFSASFARKRNRFLRTINPPQQTEEPAKTDNSCRNEGAQYLMRGVDKNELSVDLLSTVHNQTCPLEHTRATDKVGKAYWLQNTNQQTYKPATARFDPQLEYYYHQLGLDDEPPSEKPW